MEPYECYKSYLASSITNNQKRDHMNTTNHHNSHSYHQNGICANDTYFPNGSRFIEKMDMLTFCMFPKTPEFSFGLVDFNNNGITTILFECNKLSEFQTTWAIRLFYENKPYYYFYDDRWPIPHHMRPRYYNSYSYRQNAKRNHMNATNH